MQAARRGGYRSASVVTTSDYAGAERFRGRPEDRFVENLVVLDCDSDQLLNEHPAVVEAVAETQPEDAERLSPLHVAKFLFGSILGKLSCLISVGVPRFSFGTLISW